MSGKYDVVSRYLGQFATRYNSLWAIRNDIIVSIWLTLVLSFIYVLAMIIFISQVHLEYAPAYGYLRPDLKPGPFINDRYNIHWVIFGLNNLRIFLPFLALWSFVNILGSWKRNWALRFASFLFALDIFIIVYLLVMWCLCQHPSIPGNMCNDPVLYCKAYYQDHADRCVPEVNPPISAGLLSANTPFLVWLIMSFIFAFLDWFIGSTIADTEKAVKEGRVYGLFYSDAMYS